MRKILALCLVLATLLTLAACGGTADGAPEGFKIASDDELCDYVLYAPDAWVTESNKSNYTMATVSQTDGVTLSVAKIESVYERTMQEYWEKCKTEYTFLNNFAVVEGEEGTQATIGSGERVYAGYRYIFTGDYAGTSYRYMQIFIVRGGLFSAGLYCITYTAKADTYDKYLDSVNDVLNAFYFKD